MLSAHSLRSLSRQAGFSLAAALMAALAISPALAEGNTASTMTPPAPNAANSAPQAENSLPENAESATYNLPGSQLGTTAAPAPAKTVPATRRADQ